MVCGRQPASQTAYPACRHDDHLRFGSGQASWRLPPSSTCRSSYFDELAAVLGHLDDLGVKTRILFLDASNEVLIKRYESVRRPHPLQHGNRLIDGILEERHLLEDLKERADWVIDTSSLSIHQLSPNSTGDARSAPPPWQYTSSASASNTVCPSTPISWPTCVFCPTRSGCNLRELTGRVRRSPTACSPARAGISRRLMRKLSRLRWKGYAREDKHYVTIAVGCTGGQHRSVAMSEELARHAYAHMGST